MSQPGEVGELTGVAGAVAAAVGAELASYQEGFRPATLTLASAAWAPALAAAHAGGATYFDFLSAVDELEDGFAVLAHVSTPDGRDHLLLRTVVPREAPAVATAIGVYRGAAWHERETHEMFGIDFVGNPRLDPLLLPPGFTAHPLRKDFVLASRVAKPWPGGKDPADPPGGAPARRAMAPPGVPADWEKS